MSVSPLIARQVPIWDGEKIDGFVDLALERFRPEHVRGPGFDQLDFDGDPRAVQVESFEEDDGTVVYELTVADDDVDRPRRHPVDRSAGIVDDHLGLVVETEHGRDRPDGRAMLRSDHHRPRRVGPGIAVGNRGQLAFRRRFGSRPSPGA